MQKKYPGAFLAGDLTGMVASGYLYGPGSKTADALEAASRKMAPEVVESIAGRQFGKQIFRGASVAERAAADEAAVKAAQALAESNATNSPLLAALDDVLARNPWLARQAARSYTHGASAADDAYQAYLRMLDEVEQANKAGVTARDFAKSKSIQSTLTDQQAAFLDRNRVMMLSEDAGKLPQGIDKQSFETASKRIRDTIGDISDDIVVQGSRAGGTATATSDIDFAIKVPKEQFDALIKGISRLQIQGLQLKEQ